MPLRLLVSSSQAREEIAFKLSMRRLWRYISSVHCQAALLDPFATGRLRLLSQCSRSFGFQRNPWSLITLVASMRAAAVAGGAGFRGFWPLVLCRREPALGRRSQLSFHISGPFALASSYQRAEPRCCKHMVSLDGKSASSQVLSLYSVAECRCN